MTPIALPNSLQLAAKRCVAIATDCFVHIFRARSSGAYLAPATARAVCDGPSHVALGAGVSVKWTTRSIEVDADGRLQLHAGIPVYASISHSQEFVAAIAAGEPVGVDLECRRRKWDPDAAAAMLELSVDAGTPEAVLARLGDGRSATESRARRKSTGLGVPLAGLSYLPSPGSRARRLPACSTR